MHDSDQRSELINFILSDLKERGVSRRNSVIRARIWGYQKPTMVAGVIPDVHMIHHTDHGDIELLGVADTHLEEGSLRRLIKLVTYVEARPNCGLLVATPHAARRTVLPLLEHFAKEWRDLRSRVRIATAPPKVQK